MVWMQNNRDPDFGVVNEAAKQRGATDLEQAMLDYVNNASYSSLRNSEGVRPPRKYLQSAVEYRLRNDHDDIAFKSIDEINNVSGVASGTLEV